MADTATDLVHKALEAIDRADPRAVARGLAWTRCGLGALAMMAPRRAARGWTGDDSDDPQAAMAMRGLGARDVAIGTGTLFALSHGAPARGWVEAGMLSDASDAVTSFIAMPRISRPRALLATLVSAAAAFVGYRISFTIDR